MKQFLHLAVLLPMTLFTLLSCSSQRTSVGNDHQSPHYDNYNPELVITDNSINTMSATINGGNFTDRVIIPLNFTAPHNHLKLTMLSAYMDQSGGLTFQLVTPAGDTTYMEDIDVSGSVNRALYIKSVPLPNKLIITATGFYGSLGMTLAPYSN